MAGLYRTSIHADTQALLGALGAFEQHEADVVERAGAELLAALREAVDAVGAYCRRLADHTVVEPIPPDRRAPRPRRPARAPLTQAGVIVQAVP